MAGADSVLFDRKCLEIEFFCCRGPACRQTNACGNEVSPSDLPQWPSNIDHSATGGRSAVARNRRLAVRESIIEQEFFIRIDPAQADNPCVIPTNIKTAVRLARVVDQLSATAPDRPIHAPITIQS